MGINKNGQKQNSPKNQNLELFFFPRKRNKASVSVIKMRNNFFSGSFFFLSRSTTRRRFWAEPTFCPNFLNEPLVVVNKNVCVVEWHFYDVQTPFLNPVLLNVMAAKMSTIKCCLNVNRPVLFKCNFKLLKIPLRVGSIYKYKMFKLNKLYLIAKGSLFCRMH